MKEAVKWLALIAFLGIVVFGLLFWVIVITVNGQRAL